MRLLSYVSPAGTFAIRLFAARSLTRAGLAGPRGGFFCRIGGIGGFFIGLRRESGCGYGGLSATQRRMLKAMAARVT
ncbi:hypothetical protein DRB17_19085, partial [Ferruginivarius sediminum]